MDERSINVAIVEIDKSPSIALVIGEQGGSSPPVFLVLIKKGSAQEKLWSGQSFVSMRSLSPFFSSVSFGLGLATESLIKIIQ